MTRLSSPLAARYTRLSCGSRWRVYRWFINSQKNPRNGAEPISPFELRGLRNETTLPLASRAVAAAAKLAVGPAVVARGWQLWQMLRVVLEAIRAVVVEAGGEQTGFGSLAAATALAGVFGAVTLVLTWLAGGRPARQRALLVERQLNEDWRRIPVSDNRYPIIRELLIAVAPIEKRRRRDAQVPVRAASRSH